MICQLLATQNIRYQASKEAFLARLPEILDLAVQAEPKPVPPVPATLVPLSRLWGGMLGHCERLLRAEMARLTDIGSGFHAGASKLKVGQLEALSLVRLFDQYTSLAPSLIKLVSSLLDAFGDKRQRLRMPTLAGSTGHLEKVDTRAPDEEKYGDLLESWEDLSDGEEDVRDEAGQPQTPMSVPQPELSKRQRLAAMRKESLVRIALERELLADLKKWWRDYPNYLMFIYDNVDWSEESSTLTLDNPNRFISATAATFIPLQHGITREHLAFRKELWKGSVNNPDADLKLAGISAPFSLSIATDSIPLHSHDGLDFLARVKRIPVTKTKQYPAHSMNIKQSMVEGTIDVLENFMEQVGTVAEDMDDHVILVHGYLGTIERAQSAQFSRGLEEDHKTDLSTFVLIPGLFHAKMAVVNALFRTYLKPDRSRNGDSTPYQHAGILRPKESSRFKSNPTFRQMHDFIHHDIAARVIDVFETVVHEE
ncbi:hypothetical protein FRB90_003980 [Tulasnella sp. 427]|nr:hypothetical protein FRB90_003980 [Tulasnella sp. 427]